jgi:hypothetical protein
MAIDMPVENEYGAKFDYHKLREVRIINSDKIGVQLTLTVDSWLNRQARIDGKQPTVRQCVIMGADFAMEPFYKLLKAKFSEFSDGADDFDNSFKAVKQEGGTEYIEQTVHGKVISRRSEGLKEE